MKDVLLLALNLEGGGARLAPCIPAFCRAWPLSLFVHDKPVKWVILLSLNPDGPCAPSRAQNRPVYSHPVAVFDQRLCSSVVKSAHQGLETSRANGAALTDPCVGLRPSVAAQSLLTLRMARGRCE